jgi:hypothetical protein
LAFLQDESFAFECSQNAEQIQIKITLQKVDGSTAYPIECVHIKSERYEEGRNADIAFVIIDYVDTYFSQYFIEDRDVYVPIDWNEHVCESISFYLRGSVRNLALEKMALDLFLKHGHGEHDLQGISAET